jgi:hypothetical protein
MASDNAQGKNPNSESRLVSVSVRLPKLRAEPATKYGDAEVVGRQRLEGWVLGTALLASVSLTFSLWQFSAKLWCCLVLAGLAGIIAGLLHSLKWFYKTIGDGEWEWDRGWWRLMNPLVCGVMGLSIYIVLRSGIQAKVAADGTQPGMEGFYAYGVGFLTGLFADNAMNKLRDIAYVLFGPTARPASKPHDEPALKAQVGPNLGRTSVAVTNEANGSPAEVDVESEPESV